MGRKRKGEALRTEKLNIRITPDERDALANAAKDFGMSITDLTRMVVFNGMPRLKMRTRKLQQADASLTAELIRQGALLKHLYNEYGKDGDGFDSERSARILDEIEGAVVAIRRHQELEIARLLGGDG